MKLLERLFSHDDKPVIVGSALSFERPSWLVTCVITRQESFGRVSTETRYEVTAGSEEEARRSVRSFVRRAQHGCAIESVHATRQ